MRGTGAGAYLFPPGAASTGREALEELAKRNPGRVCALLQASDEVFEGVSGSVDDIPRLLGECLDNVPPGIRPPYHGKCAEIQAIADAIENGIDDFTGSTIATGSYKPGAPSIDPCKSCQSVLDELGITFVEGWPVIAPPTIPGAIGGGAGAGAGIAR